MDIVPDHLPLIPPEALATAGNKSPNIIAKTMNRFMISIPFKAQMRRKRIAKKLEMRFRGRCWTGANYRKFEVLARDQFYGVPVKNREIAGREQLTYLATASIAVY